MGDVTKKREKFPKGLKKNHNHFSILMCEFWKPQTGGLNFSKMSELGLDTILEKRQKLAFFKDKFALFLKRKLEFLHGRKTASDS